MNSLKRIKREDSNSSSHRRLEILVVEDNRLDPRDITIRQHQILLQIMKRPKHWRKPNWQRTRRGIAPNGSDRRKPEKKSFGAKRIDPTRKMDLEDRLLDRREMVRRLVFLKRISPVSSIRLWRCALPHPFGEPKKSRMKPT